MIIKSWNKLSIYTKLAIILSIVYVFAFSTYTLALHYSFKTTGGDLGQYTQMFWSTINGRGLFQTNFRIHLQNPTGSYFGEHFAPILFLFIPIFALCPRPETLLVIKAIVGGFSVFALYMLAREVTNNEKASLTIALAYILNPHLINARIFDFQEQSLLPLLIFMTYRAYLRHNLKSFVILWFLTLSVNEYMGVFMAMFGMALLLERFNISEILRGKLLKSSLGRLCLLMIVVSILWLLLADYVMKLFSPRGIATIPSEYFVVEIKDTSPWNIIRVVLENPQIFLDSLYYDIHKKLLGTLAFLAPFLPSISQLHFTLPFMPYLFIALMSRFEPYYVIGAHYSFYLAPFAFIGITRFIGKLNNDKKPDHVTKILKGILMISIIGVIIYSISLVSIGMIPTIDEHTKILRDVIAQIPDDAYVLTQNNIFPHLATRINAYSTSDEKRFNEMLSVLNISFDYILLDLKGTAWGVKWARQLTPYVVDLMKAREYGIVLYYDGIILLKRGYSETIKDIYFPGEVIKPSDLYVERGINLGNLIVYKPKSGLGTIWFGPYLLLPPGEYEVTYTIRIKGDVNTESPLLILDIVSDKGKSIHARKILYAIDLPREMDWIDVTLRFGLREVVSDIEFRGITMSDNVTVYLKQIKVDYINNEPVTTFLDTFTIDQFSLERGERIGWVYVYRPEYGEGIFWFGPYIQLKPGSYNATYWIKIEKLPGEFEATKPILILDVSRNKAQDIVAKIEIYSNDITFGVWTPITISFELRECSVDVEFRGHVASSGYVIYFLKLNLVGVR